MLALQMGLFGLLGIFSRFGLDVLLKSDSFPYSTLLINILGSVAAGVIYVLGEKGLIPTNLQLGLLVGFCGGFTTFSAFTLQTVQLLEKGRFFLGAFYLIGTPIFALLIAGSAVILTRKII